MRRQKSSVNVAVSRFVDVHVCEYYNLNLYTPLAILAQALGIDFLVDLSPKCDDVALSLSYLSCLKKEKHQYCMGKACETRNAAVETARQQNACQNLRQDPGCMGGRDFRDQNDAKRGRKRGRKS